MNNFNQEIFDYVLSKKGTWSNSTIDTAYYKLCTAAKEDFKPDFLYKKLTTENYSPYTIKMYFTLARQYEKDVRKTSKIEEWMQNNRLKFKNCYKPKTKRITKEQFESLLRSSEINTDLYNFLVLMGKFGLRKSEALSVQWEDFSNDSLCVVGKGNKQRIIPLSKELLKEPLLNGKVIKEGFTYWKFFESIKPFTPHDFRAYAITYWVKERGLDLSEAAMLAGHAKTDTTNRYIRNDLNKIGEKLK